MMEINKNTALVVEFEDGHLCVYKLFPFEHEVLIAKVSPYGDIIACRDNHALTQTEIELCQVLHNQFRKEGNLEPLV